MTRLILDYPIKGLKAVRIEGDELHYLTRVRRHKEGDVVEIEDADGRRFQAIISHADRQRAGLEIEKEIDVACAVWPVNLMVAPPKANLLDDVVRKLSEIGVARLTVVLTERTVARPTKKRVDRWQRIARESRRQCGREKPLDVDLVLPLDEALQMRGSRGSALILHPGAHRFPTILEAGPAAIPLTIAVGPEGGFTDEEIEMAKEQGFEPAGLGASILRIETAVITAAVLGVALIGGFRDA